ncbi:MAG: amidohydrolase family protein [Betaproteobacteria bacterium]|nr:amidohydrolase family protein [Betaproteobacteria bacterium]
MYDLVIRNGTVVDGTGLPKYRADVGVSGDRIAAIGRIGEKGKEEIDATGQVVSPGFIDGHTHMDAQVFWDPLGSCSCWHGVTTAVMGNCGFTLAPGSAEQRDMILSNIVRAEDISPAAIGAAVRWNWTTFREYMDVVDKLPKAINYAANIGHSALRTHVMGPRAFEQQASADDLGAMEHELLDALDAGAIGFTSSRSTGHRLPEPDNRPVASVHASWEELSQLVCVMGTTGRGIFEYSRERETRSKDPEVRKAANDRLRDLAVKSGVPITFGIPAGSAGTQDNLALLDATAAAGGRMFGQTHTRGISHVLSFKGRLQFDDFPEWARIRALPIEEQRKVFSDPEQRKRLVAATKNGAYRTGGGEPRKPTYENMYVMYSAVSRNPTVAELAAKRNADPVEVMMDLALDSNFNQLFMQFDEATVPKSEAEALATLRHPRTVMTFSDSGAHVSLIMDSSIHTHLLAYWVRERNAFSLEEGVKMITLTPAMAWGFTDRGLLRQGCIADLNIFDPATLAPEIPTIEHDLPTGARRLKQKSSGIMATILAGKVAFRNGEHTGALGGKLLRSTTAGVR